MERKDIIFAYNMKTELDRLKAEQKKLIQRLPELITEIEKREAALRGLGL